MSPYQELLELARQQVDAARRGDLDAAVEAFDARAELLDDAPAPSATDLAAIHETLVLDRELSSAIRERMIAIREESREMQRGRTALTGYGASHGRDAVLVDRDA
jgi:hypothetical protein